VNLTTIPLLRDILSAKLPLDLTPPRPPITLSLLARELDVSPQRLFRLVEEGYLPRYSAADHSPADHSPPSPSTVLSCPPQPALLWLRQWFSPPLYKPMFSIDDVAELLEINAREATRLAAIFDIPLIHDAGLGLMMSAWGVRQLLRAVLSGGRTEAGEGEGEGQRFDRTWLVWWLMEGDPARLQQPPRFTQQLEDEIQRVAGLEEPQRTIRKEQLSQQWKEAKAVAGRDGERMDEVDRLFRELAS
jgi:hypothetical protein